MSIARCGRSIRSGKSFALPIVFCFFDRYDFYRQTMTTIPTHFELQLERTEGHIRLVFEKTLPVLSSAVLNGGWVHADAILNLRVPKHPENTNAPLEPPENTLTGYCDRFGWQGVTVGMMTAASMNSLRMAQNQVHGIKTIVLVTSGLSNPMRAGDRSEYRSLDNTMPGAGTINTAIVTSAALTPAAMVETITLATEAKAAAMQACGVRSRISDAIATGTGTDAIALACGEGRHRIRYCGKHTLFGEIMARLVIQATTASISWESPDVGLTF